jgi:cytochrome c biogenesis protein CcmG, thiol:disulfide interchange protein DsbE
VTASAPKPVGSHPARRPFVVFLPLMLFAALAGLFLFRLYSGDASLLPSALVGRQVPDFDLPPVEGLADKQGFSAADLRQGKVTLVNVFASWCVPCHEEHELIMRLSADPLFGRAGARLFAIAYKDDPANIKRFLAEKGDPFARIGADRRGRVAIDWGVYGVPETFIVMGDGTIAYRFVGPVTEEAYRQMILPEIEKALH